MKVRLAQKIMNTHYRYMCEISDYMPYNSKQRDKARRLMIKAYQRNTVNKEI